MTSDILFVSRGRGRGHATHDLLIGKQLQLIDPEINVRFASYGTGASVIGQCGIELHDLGLPEKNSFSETVQRINHVLEATNPTLLISHEEFGALAAASGKGIPSIFLTHWFYPSTHELSSAVAHANTVLVLETERSFPFSPPAGSVVRYLGPMVRELSYQPNQRQQIRSLLGLEETDLFLLFLPGSVREETFPLATLARDAFSRFGDRRKRMIWVTGDDPAARSAAMSQDKWINTIGYTPHLEALMIASDLVLTKGTYNTLCELAALAVPAITVSNGRNPVDDIYARTRPNITFFTIEGLTSERLATEMLRHLGCRRFSNERSVEFKPTSPRLVAEAILRCGLTHSSRWQDEASQRQFRL